MKFIRIVLLYVLFFIVALIIGGMFVQQLGDGLFVLFTFIGPGILTWWLERRRTSSRKRVTATEHSLVSSAARREPPEPVTVPPTRATTPVPSPFRPSGEAKKRRIVEQNAAQIARLQVAGPPYGNAGSEDVGTKRAGRLLDGKEHNELVWRKDA